MVIGLPRALLYYKYQYLWETFFHELGVDTLVSGETTQKTLEDGMRFSIDECCIPAKIYMGHVHSLLGQCDYILAPRLDNFGKKEMVCVKFNALYDIIRNTFKDAPLITYNLDALHGSNELSGFIAMGKMLGKNSAQSLKAYIIAKKAQHTHDEQRFSAQCLALECEDIPSILIVTHPYNIYDSLLGQPIVNLIKSCGGMPIYADAFDKTKCERNSKALSTHLYWTYNKQLLGAIELYKDQVDGILLVSAFPCGPDSLVNELIMRKLHSLPVANILLDELSSSAGLETRIESFMDILKYRKARRQNG